MSHKILRNIEIDLNDPRSIDAAIREIRDLQRFLRDCINELIRKLADEGVKEAKAQIVAMDAVDTGELENSIYATYDPDSRIGYVIAGAAHAFYVEYGTGPRGEEAGDHPWAGTIGWQHDVGPTIHENPQHPEWGRGWWYPGDDGKWHWTNGQPYRPFMYNTMEYLEEAAEALGRDLIFQQ